MDMQTSYPPPISLIITITTRERTSELVEFFKDFGVMFNLGLLGRGTAESSILDMLGLGDTEKAVLFSSAPSVRVPRLLKRMRSEMNLQKAGAGIAFSIPIASVGGRKTLSHLTGSGCEVEEGERSMSEKKCELILTVVNRGHADDVMEAAKEKGAGGGTVLHARGMGLHEAEKFFGVTITPEKEVVLILVEAQYKKDIMAAICEKVGLRTPGHGLSFSVPVDYVVGVQRLEALFDEDAE